MIHRDADASRRTIENCHDGRGRVHCTERFRDRQHVGAGFGLVHDDLVEPGASIGEHTHHHSEEIYLILSGQGEMLLDGQPVEVGPGDLCITRHGHSHGLTNTGSEPMRLLVVEADTPDTGGRDGIGKS